MAMPRRQRAISFRPSSALRQWLRPGSVVRAVVLQPLGADTAVISVRGVNAVAESSLPLVRGQVLYASVTEVGAQVHLRLVPAPAIEEASRATTAAELARHLASIGIEPTDEHVCLAAAMLVAELPVTSEHFVTVARLAQGADGDPDGTGEAAAYVVRHGLERDQATVAAIRAALFESPSLGELLAVLEATASSDNSPPGAQELRAGACRCLSSVRLGGPVEWFRVSAALCGVDLDPPADDAGLRSLLESSLGGAPAPAQAVQRLCTLLGGLCVANNVPARGGTKRWVLQVPFPHGDTVGTCFAELATLVGPVSRASLARYTDARLWVPLEESVVHARVQVRDGRAEATLRIGGADDAGVVAAGAGEWLKGALPDFGIELSRVSANAGQGSSAVGCDDQSVPLVGLDFEV